MRTTLGPIGLLVPSNIVPESQTNRAWDVVLDLRPADGGPLHRRLAAALREAIRRGDIADGDPLPPSRSLAVELGCSRWAVTEAFSQLLAEGYLQARTGSGTRVRWSGGDQPPRGGAAVVSTRDSQLPRYDLVPGLPDLRAFPRRRWADAVASQTRTVAFSELGYQPVDGHPRLRELLASYLRRSRHVSTSPDDLTVCTSVSDGIRWLCRMLAADGITAIGCEDPGWTR